MAEIVMPVLGPEMNEGRVARWLKNAGDEVRQGEAILEVEGDKTTVEITAPESGTLRILVEAGVDVPVRQVIAWIGAAEEAPPASPGPPLPPAAPEETAGAAVSSELPASTRVSRVAVKLAQQLGIDISTVTPTGVGDRIMEEDVRRAAAALSLPEPVIPETPPPSTPAPASSEPPRSSSREAPAVAPAAGSVESVEEGELVPLTAARRVTAERMAASWHTVPRATLHAEVDMRRVMRLRQELNADWAPSGVHVGVDALLVRAAALALAAHPQMNALWEEGRGVRLLRAVSIGVAVDTDRGLLVPVLKDVGSASLDEISRRLAELIALVRDGKIQGEQMAGGSFTLTNLGTRGVDAFSPIVNPPQAGILAAGRIAKRPWVDGDELIVAETVTLSLAFDHRVIDGGPAADILAAIRENLEHPLRLVSTL